MKRSAIALAAAGAAAAAALAAGCSSNTTNSVTGPKAGSSSSASGAAMVQTQKSGNLGTILTDSSGRTLYLFKADTGTQSTCNGSCAIAWPPLLTNGTPKAGTGIDGGQLGTTHRSDGHTQVTYHGHPLYYFAEDSNAGDTHGQNVNAFGAEWYVLGTNGSAITTPQSSGGMTSPSTGGSSGNGGY